MFAAHRRPAPAEEVPEWEPTGLPANASTLERHRDTAEIRVRPADLAAMLAAWEADE
jgi:hypothetical protein